ncbi:MAG: DEAD/DEAH box helicase [Leadbetterella sp.]|nr:DEAD/DEAH box helicase [Leadbetterella sp.]
MNFKAFYNNSEKRIIDTVLSLWTTGDVAMQQYLKLIFEKEEILAEPVFQNMFPWEPADLNFGAMVDIFDENFIKSLDKIRNLEYRFPQDRHPYLHQVKSWKSALIDKKSILVTTGTGSGKTECFMLPVLNDIFTNNPNSTGVNAIFLYPLNALIGSQKKRMDEWCRALGNISYAVYNGNTDESAPNNLQTQAFPEIISRKGIRESPPQILFTNPTMLEYMLVRDKDTSILTNSKGKLRWILLDEAHTLTGSKASEMALLIRRVIDAFDVDIKDVRFAVTSATVGAGNDDALKLFMSDLCGINIDRIEVISGRRILPNLNLDSLYQSGEINDYFDLIRNRLLENSCIDTSDIQNITGLNDMDDQIAYLDTLADIKVDNQPILPIRGHFFARNINGLYVCTNSGCGHGANLPTPIFSTITSISKKLCACGYPMLELIACKTCGTYMMEGENANNIVQQNSRQINDFFQVDDMDEEEEEGGLISIKRRIVLAKSINNKPFVHENLRPVSINQDGIIDENTESLLFEILEEDGACKCPYCSENLKNPFHFRLSAAFLNRLMSDIILEQTNDAIPIQNQMLWNGKKYISFTDSRQGTAKIAALINIDSETYWFRSQIFHSLIKKRKDGIPDLLNEQERNEIQEEIDGYRNELVRPNLPPFLIRDFENRIVENERKLNPAIPPVSESRISWNEILNNPRFVGEDFKNLFYNSVGGNLVTQGNDYLKSLIFNEFARRLPRERSLENLGMVNVVYPDLDNLVTPQIAIDLQINNEEWKSLVKIALDYVIRYKCNYFIHNNVRAISSASSRHRSLKIYPNDTQVPNVAKWPIFDRHNIRPNRLALLICAGLGFHNLDEIDNDTEGQINDLLERLWITIRINLLEIDGQDGGYKLNLENKTVFELAETLWLCPVKKRLIDKTFKGYSPWIMGRLEGGNISSFHVGESISFPFFEFPFNLNIENVYDAEATNLWIRNNEKINGLIENGLWNSLHERIINYKPLYLAGEHSAQQTEKRLIQLEEKFQEGKINILSCSTTMEMGVDIGGISAVMMSNVPPSPANYLQRTGRAGRRAENKSLAFTICAANPIGATVISNPKWALEHIIAPPALTFSSKAVVFRHLNAFLLGKFIQIELKGIRVTEKVENFFFNLERNGETLSGKFSVWLLSLNNQAYEETINGILKKTPLENQSCAEIIQHVLLNFEKVKQILENRNQNFEAALETFINLEGYTQNSPAYRAIAFRKKQFLQKNLLNCLSEEGFLPAGGIPTGVVEFNNVYYNGINNNNEKQLPSYHITRALSEYAPGMGIVIDGWTYKSEGILMKNNWGGEAERNLLQHCTSCGSEHIISKAGQQITTVCPNCQANALTGIRHDSNFTEIIEPVGFAVDLFSERTRDISEASKVQHIEPLLVGVEPWSDATHPVFEYRDSKENAEILFYNYGEGSGYSVCLECGRASTNADDLHNHKRLRGGKNEQNTVICGGNDNPYAIRSEVLLVGRFHTDFFEIRCKDERGALINDEITLYSVGQALSKSLTSFLGIEEQEVNFGIKKYQGFSSLFLFDTAKGGAGYVYQCANFFEEICKEALIKLQQCDCTSACTKCLIDRNSQFQLEKLNRHLAIEWFRRAIDTRVPEELLTLLLNDPKKLIGSVRDDWAKLLIKKQLNEVWLVVDKEHFDNWEIESFLLMNKMKIEGCTINLVFNGPLNNLTIEQKLTLHQIASFARFYYTESYEITNHRGLTLRLVGTAKVHDGTEYDYYTNDFNAVLNSEWGNANNSFVYKQRKDTERILYPYTIDFGDLRGNIFEVPLSFNNRNINSKDLFDNFYQILSNNEKTRLRNCLEGEDITITYSDRYLVTPLGGMLLVQFIKKMKDVVGINAVNSLNVATRSMSEAYNNRYLFENFTNNEHREDFVGSIAEDCGLGEVNFNVGHNTPHHRYLEIRVGNEIVATIRPEAGISHGWYCERTIRTELTTGDQNLRLYQNNNGYLLYTLIFN